MYCQMKWKGTCHVQSLSITWSFTYYKFILCYYLLMLYQAMNLLFIFKFESFKLHLLLLFEIKIRINSIKSKAKCGQNVSLDIWGQTSPFDIFILKSNIVKCLYHYRICLYTSYKKNVTFKEHESFFWEIIFKYVVFWMPRAINHDFCQ